MGGLIPEVADGGALIVDLPRGFADDPPDCLGLAALTARHLMDPGAGGPGALAHKRAWRTSHRLEADCSSFCFWSALDDGVTGLAAEFARAVPPDTARLASMVAAQLRLADVYQSDAYSRMIDLLEAAAWGPGTPALGTKTTLAAITVTDMRNCLEASCAEGMVVYPRDAAKGESARIAPLQARWRGERLTSVQPGGTVRVAVAVPVTVPALGAVELAVEILGSHGIGGRLAPALRGDRPLAYGLGAFQLSRGTVGVLAAQAQVAPEHADVAARVLLETVRSVLSGPVSESERRASAARVRTALLLQVDQPFGPVDELRRRHRGQLPLTDLAAAVRERAEDGALPAELPGHPVAMAAVGALPSRCREQWETR